MSVNGFRRTVAALLMTLAGCSSNPPAPRTAASGVDARAFLGQSVPRTAVDRQGWANDIYAALSVLAIEPTRQNICAVVAVIAQESSFRVDPPVPNLPAVAWREIDERAARAGVPKTLVREVLRLSSPSGRSYAQRIDSAKTEKELSDIFEDMIGSIPLGRTLFASRNPIRTRGPMQVQFSFAEQYSKTKPYPYPVKTTIADEVFTRRGGIYFGVAHLLGYSPPYDDYLYRFADFNAGQYSSRNAAFQAALSRVSGIPLVADGSLLPRDSESTSPGITELALRAIAGRLNVTPAAAREALEQGKKLEFERSAVYLRIFSLAERTEEKSLPRAVLPSIKLQGPKLSRSLTTAWYAKRVEDRFNRCLSQR